MVRKPRSPQDGLDAALNKNPKDERKATKEKIETWLALPELDSSVRMELNKILGDYGNWQIFEPRYKDLKKDYLDKLDPQTGKHPGLEKQKERIEGLNIPKNFPALFPELLAYRDSIRKGAWLEGFATGEHIKDAIKNLGIGNPSLLTELDGYIKKLDTLARTMKVGPESKAASLHQEFNDAVAQGHLEAALVQAKFVADAYAESARKGQIKKKNKKKKN